MRTFTEREKIEIMRSAGYDKTAAHTAINIGVYFFDSLEVLKEFDPDADYEVGTIDDDEVYFVNTI